MDMDVFRKVWEMEEVSITGAHSDPAYGSPLAAETLLSLGTGTFTLVVRHNDFPGSGTGRIAYEATSAVYNPTVWAPCALSAVYYESAQSALQYSAGFRYPAGVL